MEKREWSMAELQSKAEAYCAQAEHCTSEIMEKMRVWGATRVQAEQVTERLIEGKYIDEARYCRAFVHDKLLYQGWGRVKMRAALQAKRLPSACIAAALEDIDETEYFRVLEKVIQKKKGSPEQVMRFCMQRGFALSEIKHLIKGQTGEE